MAMRGPEAYQQTELVAPAQMLLSLTRI
jgi:hypothetical protein